MQEQLPITPPPVTHNPALDNRSIPELLKETWEETEKLFRQELELAVTELESRAKRAKTDLISASIAGAALYAGMLSLLAAVILLLSLAVAPWVAALIVGAATTIVGVALLAKAKKGLDPDNLKPERTVRSVKRDVQMLKEAVK